MGFHEALEALAADYDDWLDTYELRTVRVIHEPETENLLSTYMGRKHAFEDLVRRGAKVYIAFPDIRLPGDSGDLTTEIVRGERRSFERS